jgi:hypothetical protein
MIRKDRSDMPGRSKIPIAILSAALAFLGAMPLSAGETLSLRPTQGQPRDRVYLEASGFRPGSLVYLYFSDQWAEEDGEIRGLPSWKWLKNAYAGAEGRRGEGTISTTFKVPRLLNDGRQNSEVGGGVYFVYAAYEHRGRVEAAAKYYLTGLHPPDPDEGPSGIGVKIRGFGLPPKEEITIFFDGERLEIKKGDEKTDEKGKFSLWVVIPRSLPGEHIISVPIGRETWETIFTVIDDD